MGLGRPPHVKSIDFLAEDFAGVALGVTLMVVFPPPNEKPPALEAGLAAGLGAGVDLTGVGLAAGLTGAALAAGLTGVGLAAGLGAGLTGAPTFLAGAAAGLTGVAGLTFKYIH